ncbi:DUF3592 domain-containing protein [Actinomadura harenae]|uniref:DUF3592 domain-containing protein n=1 Tax=Actinomadura harenae TaxID=2483351 RepID=A0A3M2LT61_9ACTN|nr:DUF3592 domain-containing protein [Actinomadura harenae]RMI40422.1 DUF3592 domain-containing protein [Actinomadura harenae]
MGAGGRTGPWQRVGGWAFLALQVVLGAVVVALAVVLIVIGVGVVSHGVDGMTGASSLRSTADGTVLAHWRENESRGGRIDRIQVRFTAADGTSHEFTESGRAKAGDRIRVHYKAGNPGDASVHSATGNRAMAGLGVLIGLAMVVCMLGVLLRGGWDAFHALREWAPERPARKARRPLPVD